MIDVIEKRVLIVVKTYPNPSQKYQETVCTAGISDQGEWIRMYPIPFRQYSDDKKFPLFTIVNTKLSRNPADQRPESYKVFDDQIEIERILHSKANLEERVRFIKPLVRDSLEQIQSDQEKYGTSLAVFKPKSIDGIIVEQTDKTWTDSQMFALRQQSIFDTTEKHNILEKIPYDFSLKFHCNGINCKGHTLKITSWEINQTFRQFTKRYGSEELAIAKLKQAIQGLYSIDRDFYLFVGTIHRWNTFIIIGHFSYPYHYLKNDPKQISIDQIGMKND